MILDTCGLLAWLCTPAVFSAETHRDLEAAMRAGRLGYCAVSVWEIAWKHRLGKLPLPLPLPEFDTALRGAGLIAYPADHELWWRMATMDWAHRDPADRLIVALAESLRRPLVTNDTVLCQRYRECRW